MGKYHNTLDMNNDNSASLILRNVTPNSTVLEFGPANGYMTQYMKEYLNCSTHIVELDYDDGLLASIFSDNYLIGFPNGDAEFYHWVNWVKYKFDHIIFADVLEHLKDPWQILKIASQNLKQDGTILISIPNVGHNSVLIDLWNGKFNYRDLGLLDNTHLRFFTRNSLTKMVEDASLYVHKEMNTFCATEHTEFKNTIDDIPIGASFSLSERPDGNLYQFVWELKKL